MEKKWTSVIRLQKKVRISLAVMCLSRCKLGRLLVQLHCVPLMLSDNGVINRLLEDSVYVGAPEIMGRTEMNWLKRSYTRDFTPLRFFNCVSGYGVGVKVEWGERGNDTRRSSGPEEGPQGVDPPTPGKICSQRAPCSRDTRDIPPRLLCHGHCLWGCHHQGILAHTDTHVCVMGFFCGGFAVTPIWK